MYGTKKTTKSINKGAPVGKDLENNKKVSAEKVETKVEGSRETDTKELIEKDPESKKAYENISKEINKESDEKKEEAARKEIPGAKTEINNKGIGITKDENTGSNKNTVKEDKKEEPVKELVSENGTKATIDVNNVKDVPAEETKKSTPVVEDKKEEKTEENTTKGIQSMFADEEEDIKEDSKEFSKQVKEEAVKEDKKEVTKVVLPTTESTETETAKVVAEEKSVEETKSAPKAEVVETVKEVKTNKVAEEKVEVVTEERFALDDTFKVANRDQDIIFNVTSGVATSVENSDEQIKVTIINGGKQIKVENQFKDFDANQISFKVNGETVFVSFK